MESNGISLCYEAIGDAADPVMLLIMGVGEQLIAWPDGFCEILAGHGFRVIRFDNRDVGWSDWFDEAGDVDLAGLAAGDLSTVRYGLSDMVADTVGLLAALDVSRAHVVGVSMGGGIAQQMAIENPELVASLASIMATTSDGKAGGSSIDNAAALLPQPGADREVAIAADVALFRLIGSPGFETSDAELIRRATAKVGRAYHPAGTLRQIAANATAPDRTERLRTLETPTVVIHGDSDPLVELSGGRATAEAIPGAELLVVQGMGHDLPAGAWKLIVDAIVANAAKA
ncbi:alpha/beta hydrolase [Actinoplanes sp. NPDC051470]|uniref:alpha/beta fold hydrolase n=1 Tax=Actinoplanes sp. NPDC051470 TaxID=3157224 RepID=UPI003430792B